MFLACGGGYGNCVTSVNDVYINVVIIVAIMVTLAFAYWFINKRY